MRFRIRLSTLCLLVVVVALALWIFLLTARYNALHVEIQRLRAELKVQANMYSAQIRARAQAMEQNAKHQPE